MKFANVHLMSVTHTIQSAGLRILDVIPLEAGEHMQVRASWTAGHASVSSFHTYCCRAARLVYFHILLPSRDEKLSKM